jgi:hypothetical protein
MGRVAFGGSLQVTQAKYIVAEYMSGDLSPCFFGKCAQEVWDSNPVTIAISLIVLELLNSKIAKRRIFSRCGIAAGMPGPIPGWISVGKRVI